MPANTVTTPPVQAVPVNVTVREIQPVSEIADTFQLTGIVKPRAVVEVAAEVPGRIETYGTRAKELQRGNRSFPAGSAINEGEPVSAGDPLVTLNQELLRARHDRAAAHYDNQEQEYQRIAGLFERGSAPATEMRNARTSRDMAKADLDEAARSLARATILAPIDGTLNDWRMEKGEYASPGTPVAEIVDIDTVKVDVHVPERDIGYLRVGQTAEITTLGSDASSVIGTITYINALADDATRTTRIEVTADNRVPTTQTEGDTAGGEYRLRSGQIVKVRLTRRMLKDTTMIPLASVIPLEDGKEVYVVNQGKAERRRVELGFIRGREIQAVSGLERGDLLIVAGHRLVGPGQPVNVVDEPRPGQQPGSSGGSKESVP